MGPDPSYKGPPTVVYDSSLDVRHNKDFEAFFNNLGVATETFPSIKVWNSRICFCGLFALRTILAPVSESCAVTVKDRSRREARLPSTSIGSYCKPSKIFWTAAMTLKNVEISVTGPSNREATNPFIV